jgi:ribosomal protein S18 acetylase RimI-like enzyme
LRVTTFHADYLSAAAALFVQNYRAQRLMTPVLPDLMEDRVRVSAMLEQLFRACPGVITLENDRLVGYMGWLIVDAFRGTDRRGAYVPEWGHACVEQDKARIYRAMYRLAAELWARAGCQTHAVTLLAHDSAAAKAWFWNGFGLTVVDAVRPTQPLEELPSSSLSIRKASVADTHALAELDAEHCAHYARSPIFMPPRMGSDATEYAAFLSRPKNSVWLAVDGNTAVGFIRFEGYHFEGVAIAASEDAIAISGAYVRPAYRGQRAAATMLDAALRDYRARGFTFCVVNFESFNPEAVAFWMKHFVPVCVSVLRVPEATPLKHA